MNEKSQILLPLTAVILLVLCFYGSLRLAETETSPASFKAVLLFLAYLVVLGILISSLVLAIRRVLGEGRVTSMSGVALLLPLLGIISFLILAWLASYT